jgi:hypothetical protein
MGHALHARVSIEFMQGSVSYSEFRYTGSAALELDGLKLHACVTHHVPTSCDANISPANPGGVWNNDEHRYVVFRNFKSMNERI